MLTDTDFMEIHKFELKSDMAMMFLFFHMLQAPVGFFFFCYLQFHKLHFTIYCKIVIKDFFHFLVEYFSFHSVPYWWGWILNFDGMFNSCRKIHLTLIITDIKYVSSFQSHASALLFQPHECILIFSFSKPYPI